jgi:hypothetical protein
MTAPTIETPETLREAVAQSSLLYPESFTASLLLRHAAAWEADRAALASALEQLEAKDQERKSDEAIHQAQDANLVAENKRLLEQLEAIP